MAKEKVVEYPFPTRYGSHASMVVSEETEKLGDPTVCVCKDEHGMYVTEKKRLDDRMADPNRHSDTEWRRNKFNAITGSVIEIVVHPEVVGV